VTHLHDELLARWAHEAGGACACGRTHALRLREVLLGPGALDEAAERISRSPSGAVWVLSDANTEEAAGARLKAAIRNRRLSGRVLPARPRPVPTDTLVTELAAEVRAAAPQLLVAVGSGVVSDLGKAVSLETGVPNWAVATAASVDAYTSATAAIRVGGYHRSVPAAAADVVVCDLGVLVAAPRVLFLDGIGDLLAKYLARLDWQVAHLAAGEWFCEALSASAVDAARMAIEAAGRAPGGEAALPSDVISALMEASIVSGLCMQAAGSSRPAAGAEHTIAHFWEMAGAVGREELDYHGVLVGAASRAVLRGYAAWAQRLAAVAPDPTARRMELDREPPWELAFPPEMARFRGTLDAVAAARAPAKAALEARLEAFTRRRGELVASVAPLLEELASAVATLERFGFPFAPAELGLAEPWRTLGVRAVRSLRDRYTLFDLAHDLGEEAALVSAVEAALG
jgi:glycerol-1-phosphate dehydrogenase [NAD(P)+]